MDFSALVPKPLKRVVTLAIAALALIVLLQAATIALLLAQGARCGAALPALGARGFEPGQSQADHPA